MSKVNFNMNEYIINLVSKGKNIEEISKILNIEISYIISSLKKIKKEIIMSLNENKFYLVMMIDELLSKKKNSQTIRKIVIENKTKIIKYLNEGYSSELIVEFLQTTKEKYLSNLKSLYFMICAYGTEKEKTLLPMIKFSILEVIELLKQENFIDKENNKKIVVPHNEKMILKGINDEQVKTNCSVGKVFDFECEKQIKFIVISDTHFGSEFENLKYLEEVYDYAAKNGIKHIFHTGDFLEGTYDNYRRCKKEYSKIESQVEHTLKNYCYDPSITNHILLGNHDAFPIISNNYNPSEYLKERKDFNLLGYRTAYIKIKEEYISLKHEISRLVNELEDVTVLLNFLGHSHQYKCYYDGKYALFRVPTLSDMPSNKHTIINRGFLAGSINFDNDKASNLQIEFINFDSENYAISFERKLTK